MPKPPSGSAIACARAIDDVPVEEAGSMLHFHLRMLISSSKVCCILCSDEGAADCFDIR